MSVTEEYCRSLNDHFKELYEAEEELQKVKREGKLAKKALEDAKKRQSECQGIQRALSAQSENVIRELETAKQMATKADEKLTNAKELETKYQRQTQTLIDEINNFLDSVLKNGVSNRNSRKTVAC